jgi:hypothetical protein
VNELDSLGFSWIEPSQEIADATNNEGVLFHIENTFVQLRTFPFIFTHLQSSVTTVVSGDDPDDDVMDDVEENVQIFDNPPDSVPPLPHDEVPTPGPDVVMAENLIQDAMDHAEI